MFEVIGRRLDWATSPQMQSFYAKRKINFVPAHPEVKTEPSLAAVLKDAKIFAIDDAYAGANRKRIMDRWIAEILPRPDARVMTMVAAGEVSASRTGLRISRDPALAITVVALWALLALFVIYPLLMLLATAFLNEGRPAFGPLASALQKPGTQRAFPKLTVFYLGVPDTTPEFARTGEAEAYFDRLLRAQK